MSCWPQGSATSLVIQRCCSHSPGYELPWGAAPSDERLRIGDSDCLPLPICILPQCLCGPRVLVVVRASCYNLDMTTQLRGCRRETCILLEFSCVHVWCGPFWTCILGTSASCLRRLALLRLLPAHRGPCQLTGIPELLGLTCTFRLAAKRKASRAAHRLRPQSVLHPNC